MAQPPHLPDHDPKDLAGARAQAHRAAQLVTRAARANLPARPDDSHSNMGWDLDRACFRSWPLRPGHAAPTVDLSLAPLTLSLTLEDGTIDSLPLDGVPIPEADTWLDAMLGSSGLTPAQETEIPYDLPDDVARIAVFHAPDGDEAAQALAAWFGFAASLLTDLERRHAEILPGPGPVRCWPHHFDIATYVALEDGDPETARGIGVGLSAGDESYGEPYFYINPWPQPDSMTAPLPIGHWHTAGFVGAILTSTVVMELSDRPAEAADFLETAFAAARQRLGV
ncbi:MAG: hypothetical protein AAGL24_11215 [Pseudomonadota bacterium]